MSIFSYAGEQPAPVMARAVVRANNDPEKLGRIKVEYPWFHGDSAQLPSEWARICFPYASTDSGSWFLPEVGDEVLVLFENGNFDYPIILGTLYGGKNKPPKSDRCGDFNENNKNDLKFIRTRSGHVLCFDDSDGNGGIVLRDSEDRRFEIKSKDKSLQIADGPGNRVTIDESTVTIHHKSGDQIVLKGGEITIKSSGKINLGESAAHPLILGDLFQQLFSSHTHVTAVGSSSPPSQPFTPAMLSQKVKTN